MEELTGKPLRVEVAALAADPDRARFAGQAPSSWSLTHECGVTDLDGSKPDRGRWNADVVSTGTAPTSVDASRYR